MVTQIREMAEMMQRGWILEMEEKGKGTFFQGTFSNPFPRIWKGARGMVACAT